MRRVVRRPARRVHHVDEFHPALVSVMHGFVKSWHWCERHWQKLAGAAFGAVMAFLYWPTIEHMIAKPTLVYQCEEHNITRLIVQRAQCRSDEHCSERELAVATTVDIAYDMDPLNNCEFDPPWGPHKLIADPVADWWNDLYEPLQVIAPLPPEPEPIEVAEAG